MAKDGEAAPNTPNLKQKLVSWAYIAGNPAISFLLFGFFELARLIVCSVMAHEFSVWSSWLHPTHLPDSHDLSPRAIALLQPIYALAVLQAVLCPVTTVFFHITIIRRETAYTLVMWFFGFITISTIVAAVVLLLQTLVLKSSLDKQAILRIKSELSEDDFAALGSFMAGDLPLVTFILILKADGFQTATISARHLISSPKRLPKYIRPFVRLKHKRTAVMGDPKTNTLGIEMVAGVHSGPLARLFDDYEKQGLISTHIDLESFNRRNFSIFGSKLFKLDRIRNSKRRRAFEEHRKGDDGPQFTLSDRYWSHRGYYSYTSVYWKILLLVWTVHSPLSIGFETARFAGYRTSNQPCQWQCILGVISPWPLAICVITILTSIHYRFALQRKALGIIRLDGLIKIVSIISFILPMPQGMTGMVSMTPNPAYIMWDWYSFMFSAISLALVMMWILSA